MSKTINFNGVPIVAPSAYAKTIVMPEGTQYSFHFDHEEYMDRKHYEAMFETMVKLDLLNYSSTIIQKSMFHARQEYVLQVWV